MTLSTELKNWLAQNAGSGNCFTSSGIAYNDPDNVARTGGTGDVLTSFFVAFLLGKHTVNIIANTNYTALKVINGNADIALDDTKWVYDNDGSPAGEAKYCYVAPATGSIAFSSSPVGAKIFLDGVDSGRVTDYTITGLSIGAHLYILKLDGYQNEAGQIDVVANQTVTVSKTLTRILTNERITLSNNLSNYNCYGFVTPIESFAGYQGDLKIHAIYSTGDCVSAPAVNQFNWYVWDTVNLNWSFKIQTPQMLSGSGWTQTEVSLPINAMYKVLYGSTEKIFTIGAGGVVEFGFNPLLIGAAALLFLVMASKKRR